MRRLAYAFVVTLCQVGNLFAQGQVATRDYSKADSVGLLYPKYPLKDLDGLAKKLTTPLDTEEEKFRAIYKWVCTNIENNYGLYETNQKKRSKLVGQELDEWNKKFGRVVVKELLEHYSTVCTGYAYLIRELAIRAGINCEIIDGYGKNANSTIKVGVGNHSWNAAEINGQWYLCDPTWSSGVVNAVEGRYIPSFDDSYFLTDPILFILSHYPLDSTWTLLPESFSLETFINNPIVYRNALHYALRPVSPSTFENAVKKGTAVEFKFQLSTIPASAEIVMQNQTLKKDLSALGNDLYAFHHVFKTKGKHVVHVKLNDEYVVSYTIKVY